MPSLYADSTNYPLQKFDSDDAFELGSQARTLAKRSQKNSPFRNFVIEVCSADEHCLFRCSTSSETSAANDRHLETKTKAALKFKQSSKTLEESLDEENPLFHTYYFENKSSECTKSEVSILCSGAIPIFLYNGAFPIGCISIDSRGTGLDHEIARESLRKFAQKQEKEKQGKNKEIIAGTSSGKSKKGKSDKKLKGNAWKLYEK